MTNKTLFCCSAERADLFKKILNKKYFDVDPVTIEKLNHVTDSLDNDQYSYMFFDTRSLMVEEDEHSINEVIDILSKIVEKQKDLRILLCRITDAPKDDQIIQSAIKLGIFDIITAREIPVSQTNNQLLMSKSIENVRHFIA